MRVVIDTTLLCLRKYTKGGVQRYLRNLIRHLDGAAKGVEYALWNNFVNSANLPLYRALCQQVAGMRSRPRLVLTRIPPQILNAFGIPAEVFTGAADVFHAPNGFPPPLWRARSVLTIHDLVYFEHPECFVSGHVRYWKHHVPRLASRAAMIVTVSEHARSAIIERLRIPPDRVRVIYHGIAPELLAAPILPEDDLWVRWRIRRPYILFVGTLQPNKNLERLLEAFVEIRSAGFPDHQLVLAGQPGWLVESIFAKAKALGLGAAVCFTGYVDDAALPSLYRHADVFVLPSLCEGFGIPAIEAMAFGVPVVASKTGALPEVVGNAGVLVNPLSSVDIAGAVVQVLGDGELRRSLVAQGIQRSAHFSWETAARETVEVYLQASED